MYRTEPFNIFAQTHAKIHARFFKVKVSGQFEEAYRGHHLPMGHWGQATLRPDDVEARYVWVTFPNLNIGLKVATLRPMFGLEVATTLRPDDVEARYVWVTTPKKEWAAGNISIVQMFKKCNRFQNGKKSHHGNGNYKLFYSDCILRIPFQLLTNLLYKWSKMQ